ncbi:ATP-binding protein [Pseudomonas segetis]|uniref:histidine kinase n=1 Tax=Pseudomonas segetis TaxID=298908 RepID=A0A239GRC1_9PSED|nr:ATP-binding protein [Pseudomonas segetis]SNS71687.1 PAS domain S-box-containing protein [Pseudomonas segetis]
MSSRVSPYPLRQWIWRAFVQSSLIPLVLVECVLIAVYMLSNSAIREAQMGYLRENALSQLSTSVDRERQVIESRLRGVQVQVELLRDATLQALQDKDFKPDALELNRYRTTPEGIYYSQALKNRAASFYSNLTPLAQQDHEKVLRLAQIDPLLRSIHAANPTVAAAYFNTWDSYNRIYPSIDTLAQYPRDFDMTKFNFYYKADAEHNPQRKTVWTDIYLDPAGQGWVMSAIAPVYRGDFLEGVAGLDVTVSELIEEVSDLIVPWNGYSVLIGPQNTIMVLPKAGEQDFGLEELTEASYSGAVSAEVLKPKRFSLTGRKDMQSLLAAMEQGDSSVTETYLNGRKQLVAWSEVKQTGWKLLLVVDEVNIFRETNRIASHYQSIGYLMIVGLLLFYLLFFGWMWLRSKRLSALLIDPIDAIVGMLRQLGGGQYKLQAVHSEINELESISTAVLQTAEQLQASEIKRQEAQGILQLVLESTTESLWEVDRQMLTIRVSERFRKRFGLPAQMVTFTDFNQRLHPNDVERLRHLRERFSQSDQEHFEAEYRYADAQGNYVWLLSRGKVLERDEQGHATRIAGTYVDVTRLKLAQEELRSATLEAQSASQAKSRFLSSMSHELRTPLNAIQGFAQLIELDTQGKPGRQQEADYAQEIVNASRHLTSLVDDILDLSSIESRTQQLRMEAVDVSALLHGCAELLQPEARRRELNIDVDINKDVSLYVFADVRRARQVLLNFLSNAIKYNAPPGSIRLGYEVRSDSVRLWVCDSGDGLSEEQVKQLFEPFQRLGRESSNIPGTGIGLVLCRELAHLMGGEIGVTSELGQGSCFWIDLQSAGKPSERQDDGSLAQQIPLVLCVDNNLAMAQLANDVLQGLANVRGASSAQQALTALDEELPDLLLLDLDLPTPGEGLKLLGSIHGNPAFTGLPIIVISGQSDEHLFAQARVLGARACMAKPVELKTLRRLLLSSLHLVNQAARL